MKRFLVFLFNSHYPNGGWNDIASEHFAIEKQGNSFDTFKEAVYAAKTIVGLNPYPTVQIIDTAIEKIVLECESYLLDRAEELKKNR